MDQELPKLVFIESPYAGDIEKNSRYALEALLDSIVKGEAPFASHLLYTQVLDDTKYDQRLLGLKCASAFRAKCQLLAVYTDLGISPGMKLGMDHAQSLGIDIVFRRLYHC